MNNRNVALAVIAVGALGAGAWWFTRPVSTASEKPAPVAATSAPASQVAAPVAPKAVVAAPVAPPVAAAAKPAAVKTATTGVDPELSAAMDRFIAVLEAQDFNAFVDDYLAPGMADMMKSQVEEQMRGRADLPPEVMAQMQQNLEQRMPQMIQRIKDEAAKDPQAGQKFQKLATALKTSTAQMNDAGDQATYALGSNGDKDVPPVIIMARRDGKWVLDLPSLSRAVQNQ